MENLKRAIFSGFAWKFLERFLAQGISFVVSLIVARILEPEAYGLIAIVTIFINIATVVVCGGFNAALIQSETATEEDFSTLFYLSFVLSIILYLFLFFLAPLIALFYNQEKLVLIIRILSLILPISAINTIQVAFVSRRMEFKKTFISSFFSTVISGGIGILMAVKGYGVWALVFQYLLSAVITCILQFFIVPWRPKKYFSIQRSIPLIRFGANSLGADLIGTIFNQLNSFVMGKWYSATDLAYYNKGQSFPYLISGNVSIIFSSVMFPAFSKMSNDISELKEKAKKTSCIYTYVLVPFYAGLIAVAYNLISVLLTDKWINCVPFLIIICVACILGSISPLDLTLLRALGRSDTVFRLEFIKKPLWFCMLVTASFVNVYALAFVLPLATIMEIIVNSLAIKKIMNYSLYEKCKEWGKTIIPSIVMFVCVYCMNFIPLKTSLLLVIQIIAGVSIYVLFSIFTRNEIFFYLMQMLIKKINGAELISEKSE